jgi:hypothetical protein
MVKSPFLGLNHGKITIFFRVISISGQGMIVDLEYNLRRALDRRKQRSYVVPPSGQKCVQCGRETSYRAWQLGEVAFPCGLRPCGMGWNGSSIYLPFL